MVMGRMQLWTGAVGLPRAWKNIGDKGVQPVALFKVSKKETENTLASFDEKL